VQGRPQPIAFWPPVQGKQWCGEYKPKNAIASAIASAVRAS
jgi:hypothetical protein